MAGEINKAACFFQVFCSILSCLKIPGLNQNRFFKKYLFVTLVLLPFFVTLVLFHFCS